MAGRFAALEVGTEDLVEQCKLEGAGTAYEVACQLAPHVAHDTFKKEEARVHLLTFPFRSRFARAALRCRLREANSPPHPPRPPQRPTLVLREESAP